MGTEAMLYAAIYVLLALTSLSTIVILLPEFSIRRAGMVAVPLAFDIFLIYMLR